MPEFSILKKESPLMHRKRKLIISRGSTCLLAVLLLVLCVANGYAQNLQAQLVNRPLTPDEITAYSLPATTERSGGLTSVGLGQPIYLEADVDINVPSSQIASVTWTI